MQLTNHPSTANPVVQTRLELSAGFWLEADTTLLFPEMGSAPSARSIPDAGHRGEQLAP